MNYLKIVLFGIFAFGCGNVWGQDLSSILIDGDNINLSENENSPTIYNTCKETLTISLSPDGDWPSGSFSTVNNSYSLTRIGNTVSDGQLPNTGSSSFVFNIENVQSGHYELIITKTEIEEDNPDIINITETNYYFSIIQINGFSIISDTEMNTITCSQESITLSIPNTVSNIENLIISWHNADGIINSEVLREYTTFAAGTYFATINCLGEEIQSNNSIVVNISTNINPPTANISAPNGTEITCVNTITLSASSSIGDNLIYQWSYANSTETSISLTANDIQTNPTVITLTVTNSDSECSDTATQDITVDTIAPTGLSLDMVDNSICQNSDLILIATANPDNTTYTWQGNGDANLNSFDVNTSSIGQSSITVTATNPANGCTKSINQEITIAAPPNWDSIIAGIQTVYQENEEIDLSLNNDGICWTLIGNSNISDSPETEIGTSNCSNDYIGSLSLETGRAPGSLVFILNDEGICEDSSQLTINIFPSEEPDLFIPEVLTPNGDGVNDEWNIGYKEGTEDDYHLMVYDRSGRLVYESNTLFETWKAQECPDGVYYYIIENTRESTAYRGAVTVIGKE